MRAADVDHGWVAQRRAARMSWAAIARMAGCAEADLRRHHDPASIKADWTLRPTNPRDQVRRVLRRLGLGPDHALILARLWMANGARCKSADLAAGIAGGEAARELCAEAKRCAFNRGITFAQGPGGFALTSEGLAVIADLAGMTVTP